ncbi:hypothetical protein PA7_20340 [Pseudonocardia asaccharolytica DSM 44247 = NBRC 16224]|uniref:Uncharacterized protein n=1 Tax=Pseudonocardia asaccharolytica DSM 44247 = NBRC 16224 TaxID=1123024 RepID=A0A511D0G2_9PSEU|nr:hypothetical protein PA7_20340 [Pseudonocardia asaccharolytica DSM 44247 = NBRC 16224]
MLGEPNPALEQRGGGFLHGGRDRGGHLGKALVQFSELCLQPVTHPRSLGAEGHGNR